VSRLLEQPAQGHEHNPSSHVGPASDYSENRCSPEDISAGEYRDRKQSFKPLNPYVDYEQNNAYMLKRPYADSFAYREIGAWTKTANGARRREIFDGRGTGRRRAARRARL
jgi:hypothetical protein